MSILVLTSDTLIGTPATGNLEYNGQFYGTDSALSRAQMQRITQGTAVASTSGTSIDFTSLPSWIKRITVMFNGVSLSSSSNYLIQIGAGSITSSGYVSGSTYQGSANVVGNIVSTAGFAVSSGAGAANVISGSVVLLSVGGNIWVSNHTMGLNSSGVGYSMSGGGNLSLGGTLDRIRITSTSTDTFDAGSVNILYEG